MGELEKPGQDGGQAKRGVTGVTQTPRSPGATARDSPPAIPPS